MAVTDPDVQIEVGGIRVQWSPLLGSFSRYEIQRQDEWTAWRDIAHITDHTVGSFYDYECRLGVESDYRVRLITEAGLHSSWSPSVSAVACANGCGYTLTSNEAPELGVGFMDAYGTGGAERGYTFLSAGEVVERTFYLRDFQVQFRPLEDRGVKFTRALGTVGTVVPDRPGPVSAAGAVRAICDASTSYVCVRDESGNRWFAGVQVPDAKTTNNLPATATIVVTEVTDVPSTPDAVAA